MRALRPVVVATFAAALTACASLAPAPVPSAPTVAADAPFSIAGRISARRGDSGVAGSFTWIHDAAHDAIDLSSPLGQMLAKLEGGAGGVEVTLSDGRRQSASTWRELTERALGVTIPVDGLSAWVRGIPRAGEPYSIERDARGRVALLRQQGWEVTYAYADDSQLRPLRAVLRYTGADVVEVRVVVDRWS
jgi:outer membrane lipoprotein LolB